MKLLLTKKRIVILGALTCAYLGGAAPSYSCESSTSCMMTNTSAIVGLQTLNPNEGAVAPNGAAQSSQSMQSPPGNASVSLDDSILRVRVPSGSLLNTSNVFKVVTLDGTPATGITRVRDNYAFLNSSIVSNSNGTQLTLTRNSVTFASLAQTRNEQAAARVLDDAERRGNAAQPVRLMYGLTRDEVRNAYASLSGESIADVRGAATGAVNIVISTVRDQVIGRSQVNMQSRNNLNVWATFLGGNLNLSSQSGLFGTQSQTWGGIGAIEKIIDPSLRLGVVAGGTQTNLSVSGLQGKGQAGFGHAAFYAQKTIGAAYVLGIAGWSFGQTSTTRNVLSTLQTGSFNGQGPNARIEAGYRFILNAAELTPYAALQGVWLRQNGMIESMNSFAGLYVNGQTVVSLPLSIGLQAKKAAQLSADWDLNLRGRAAYVHEFFPSRTITAQFITIPQGFETSGRPMPSNGLDLGAGLEFLNKSGLSLTLAADALLGAGAVGWRWQATAGYQW